MLFVGVKAVASVGTGPLRTSVANIVGIADLPDMFVGMADFRKSYLNMLTVVISLILTTKHFL